MLLAAAAAGCAALCLAPIGWGVSQTAAAGLAIIGAESVVDTGGSSDVVGEGFQSGCHAYVTIVGTVYPLPVAFTSSAKITVTLASGSYPVSAPNFYPLTIINPSGATVTKSVFMVNAVENPNSLLGAKCLAWLPPTSYTGTADGGVQADLCEYGQNFTYPAGGGPTLVDGGATLNNQEILSFSGAQQATRSLSLEGGNAVWAMVVTRSNASGTQGVVTYGGESQLRIDSTTRIVQIGNGDSTVAQFPVSTENSSIAWYGYDAFGDAGNAVGTLAGLGPAEGTNTYASTPLAGSATTTLWSLGGSFYFSGLGGDVVIANTRLTAAEVQGVYAFLNAKWDIDQPPMIVGATAIQPGGGVVRIGGSNFSQGGTAAAASFGGSLGATTWRSSGAVEATIPSGSYSGTSTATIANADALAFSAPDIIGVAPVLDPWGIAGANLNLRVEGEDVTCAGGPCADGSNITGAIDVSWLRNDLQNSTTASEPTWIAASSHLGGQPTIRCTGSSFLASSGNYLTGYGTAGWGSNVVFVMAAVYATGTSSAGGVVVTYDNGSNTEMSFQPSLKPSCFGVGTGAIPGVVWGTAEGSTPGSEYCYETGLNGGSNVIGLNWQNGTEVNPSPASGNTFSNGTVSICGRTDGTVTLTGEIGEVDGFNRILDSTEIALMQAYYHSKFAL